MSLGIHVAKISKIKDAKYKDMSVAIQEEVQLLGLNACQIFTHGPRNYKKNKMNINAIKKFCIEKKVDISTHGTYVSAGIWKINQKNKNTPESKKNIEHILDLLQSTDQLGGSSVVIHLPKKTPKLIVETMEVLSEHKDIVELTDKVSLVLEMPASKPDDKTYETAAKLNYLCNSIRSNKNIILNWRLCIDTSHQWSCGIEISNSKNWNDWLNELDDFTRNKISIIHLNGNSTSNFKKGKDVHEIIMSPNDGIWSTLITPEIRDFIKKDGVSICKNRESFFNYLSKEELKKFNSSSLFSIIQFAANNRIALILEVNRGDFIYTKFAIDVIKGLMSNLDK